ncbi:MAG TPA: hypothetical protein VJQ59_16770 [Candidatus Sulfotelmatobacter sp.]|nr:hypothetical protein [Candidatus Sulfotelmatobacter sp.]
MNRFLRIALFGVCVSAWAQTIAIFPIVRCAATTPAIVMWIPSTGNAGTFNCVTLGTGLSLNGNVLNVTPPAPSGTIQAETISMSTYTGSGAVSFAPKKTPLAGSAVLYWYNSTNILVASSGAVAWAGAPLSVTPPAGWSTEDSITFVYQAQ